MDNSLMLMEIVNRTQGKKTFCPHCLTADFYSTVTVMHKDIIFKDGSYLIESFIFCDNCRRRFDEKKYYVKKSARNKPCSCGSGLKFKKCCGKDLAKNQSIVELN